MKKIKLLSVLALLILVLVSSCDNSGVYDAIWNSEVVTNEDNNNVPGINGDSIFYISSVDGLKSYSLSTGETADLNSNASLRRSVAAAYDISGNYIISYDNSNLSVVSTDGQNLYTVSDPDAAFISKIRKGYGSLFYCTDGTYTLAVTVNDETQTAVLTPTLVHSLSSNGLQISVNSGVYTVYDASNKVSGYYVCTGFEETVSSEFTAASFTKDGKNVAVNDVGTLIAATPDQCYLFFNNGSATDIYYAASGSGYTLLKTLSNYSFGSGATSSAKAIVSGSTLVLMRGSYYIATSTTAGENNFEYGSLPYDTILSIEDNGSGTYYLVTYNSGIHTMTVNDADHDIGEIN